MKSISFPVVALAMFAAGFMLGGCTSAPSFSLEQRGRPGVPQQSFAAGEVPTVFVDAAWSQLPESALRVRQLPAGTIIRRLQIVSSSAWRITDLDSGRSRDFDRDPAEREQTRISLNDLGAGDYIAELWTKGTLVRSIHFSVAGAPATSRLVSGLKAPAMMPSSARGPRAAAFEYPPTPEPPSVADERLNELDAFLGLSARQKKQIAPLLRIEQQIQQSAASIHEIQEVQRKTRAQIRALLTPAQQVRYDEIGPKGLVVSRMVDRLNQLVGLSKEQQEKATVIFKEMNEKLDAFPSLEARAVDGAPIRQHARAQIRAMLTSDQQRIYDDAPQMSGGGSMHAHVVASSSDDAPSLHFTGQPEVDRMAAVQAYIAEYLQHSSSIIARVGDVSKITPHNNRLTTHDAATTAVSWAGSSSFDVEGSKRAESFRVYWEKPGSAPFKIVKIEATGGESIPL